MMNAWVALKIERQMAFVWIVGLFLGPVVNWAIYNLAYFPRPLSPWSRKRFLRFLEQEPTLAKLIENTSKFSVFHFPIFGWFFLRKESSEHGRLFWLRPCLIELVLPIFLAWLFWFEISGGLLPALLLPPPVAIIPSLHVHFVAHAILCLFMCVATFIDFDERTIPDVITIPGTLIGIAGAILFPNWHLWISLTEANTRTWPSNLRYDSPWSWSTSEGTAGLMLGLACFALWCFALADRRWIRRRGLNKAILYFFAGLFRNPAWKFLLGMWLFGSIVIVVAWSWLSPAGQQSLLSSLVGILLGGLTVWIIRWIAGLAIGMEALGFGDVTLMAMVGAYVGWQPTTIAFFLSPMIALMFVLIRYLATGDNQTPFGPYLCAGVLTVLLLWDRLWNNYFQNMLLVMGSILAPLLLAALLFMGGFLWIWRILKKLVFNV